MSDKIRALYYLVQAEVLAVYKHDDRWRIEFSNGDVTVPFKPVVTPSMRLVSVEDNGEEATLVFTRGLSVQLVDGEFDVSYRGVAVVDESPSELPPDPSPERVADGPASPDELAEDEEEVESSDVVLEAPAIELGLTTKELAE